MGTAVYSGPKACVSRQLRVEDILDALAEVRRRPPAGRLETRYTIYLRKYSRCRHGCLPEAAWAKVG